MVRPPAVQADHRGGPVLVQRHLPGHRQLSATLNPVKLGRVLEPGTHGVGANGAGAVLRGIVLDIV
jgi:hypothetical protein